MGTTFYLFYHCPPRFSTYHKMATISSRSALSDITKLQNIPKKVALVDIGAKVVTRQTTSKKLHLDAALVDNGDASSDRSFPNGVAGIDEKAGDVDVLQHSLAKYAIELALVEYDLVPVPGSKLAASALCLSLMLLEPKEKEATVWSKTLK